MSRGDQLDVPNPESVRPPSQLAEDAVRRFGGCAEEEAVITLLTVEHGRATALRGVRFALLRGALLREHVGPVAILVAASPSA